MDILDTMSSNNRATPEEVEATPEEVEATPEEVEEAVEGTRTEEDQQERIPTMSIRR